MTECIREGWLLKSPPYWKIWAAVWKKRWFVLRKCLNKKDQYYVDYYNDDLKHRLKGTIDLSLCQQAGSYLRYDSEKASQCLQWIFNLRLQGRTFYLAAESEEEMNGWLSDLCKVCNMEKEQLNNLPGPSRSVENQIPSTVNASMQPIVATGYLRLVDCSSNVQNENQGHPLDDSDYFHTENDQDRFMNEINNVIPPMVDRSKKPARGNQPRKSSTEPLHQAEPQPKLPVKKRVDSQHSAPQTQSSILSLPPTGFRDSDFEDDPCVPKSANNVAPLSFQLASFEIQYLEMSPRTNDQQTDQLSPLPAVDGQIQHEAKVVKKVDYKTIDPLMTKALQVVKDAHTHTQRTTLER